ncbi:acyl-CoA N-acyltransferase [Coniochaeta sp. PMI_546]|nr:acyl-CoA N-acyltransferase [Coniochaeta sp. PMI_546]
MAERIFIRHMRPSDEEVKAMVQLQLETFVDTGLHQAYFPKGRETWDEERVFREGQIFRRMDSPTMHWVVAFLETSLSDGTTREEIIGYSLWESPASPGIERTEEEKASARVQDLSYRPDSMDKEAHDKISAEMSVVFKHLLGEDPDNYWFLQNLAVHPKYQRKGAATKMVRWGLDEASKDAKGVVLLSSPFARPFYSAMGFETEVEMFIRNEAYAGMKIPPPKISMTAS